MKWEQTARTHNQGNPVTNKLTVGLFVVYLVALIWIVLFKLGVHFSYMANRSINLTPFREPLITHGKIEMGAVMNVIIFIPLGFYAGILFQKWTFASKLFFFFFTSLLVEALQLLLKVGAFDVTDIITNTTGGVIGAMLFAAIEKTFSNRAKAQKFINILAAIATVVMLSLLLLLKMKMLPVRYQ